MNSFVSVLALAAAASLSVPALAQPAGGERREAMKERWESMSPEQQAQAREKLRDRWPQMSPEERAAAKKRLAERRGGARAAPPASAPAGS